MKHMDLFSKSIVGINFNDYAAQVVELKYSQDKISLQAYNRKLLPAGLIKNGEIIKLEELKAFLANFLQEANPKPIEAKDLAVVFPSSKVFTHIFKFPLNLSSKEIARALTYEAETVIPFSLQEMYWDFEILETEDKSKKNASQVVLFAAISKEVADKYTSLFQSMGLIPSLFGIEVEALKYGLIKQLDPAKNDLIIDIGTLTTNYLLLQNGVVKYFLSSSKGGKYLLTSLGKEFQIPEDILVKQKEKQQWDKKLLPKITKFIENIYKLTATITREAVSIYLTGEFLNLPDFYEIAQKNFPKQNISIGDPRKYLDIDVGKFKPLDQADSSYYSPYFINAVGIGLRGLMTKTDEGINLLPDSLRTNLAGKKNAFLLVLGSIVMCLLSLAIGTFMFFQHQNLAYSRVNLEIQKSAIDKILYGTRYQEIHDEIIKFNNEVAELNTIENSLFSLPVLLSDITKLLPNGISLTGLEFNDENLSLKLTGIADTRENLLLMNQDLRNSKIVSELITPISTYDEKSDISFEIELKLIFKELIPYGITSEN